MLCCLGVLVSVFLSRFVSVKVCQYSGNIPTLIMLNFISVHKAFYTNMTLISLSVQLQ